MPKFFVISDVHGFYDEMIKTLDEAGFDKNNTEHWLVSCGDEWDRGPNPIGVMNFFNSLERKVIIRGNHLELFEDLCYRGYPEWHDHSNGTADTVICIGDYDLDQEFDLCCERALKKTRAYRNNMVDYFETKNYIFVHSWIPLINKDGLSSYYTKHHQFEFNPNWRECSAKEWAASRWGNPYELAEEGFLPDKTVVFGHYHTSYPRHKYEGKPEWENGADFSIYYGDRYVAIDACCAYSGKLNCLVIEDEFLEN